MPTGLAVGLGRRGSPAWVGTTRVRPVYTGGARVGPPPRPMATGLGGRGHYRRDGTGTRPDGRSRPGRPGLRGGGRSAAVPAAGSVESRRCGVAHGAPAQPSSTPGCCARRPAARRRRPAGVDHRVPAGARGVHRIGVGDGGGAGHLPVAGEEPHPSVEWSQQAGGADDEVATPVGPVGGVAVDVDPAGVQSVHEHIERAVAHAARGSAAGLLLPRSLDYARLNDR